MRTVGGLTFEPQEAGTRMSWSGTIELHGFIGLAAPLVSWIG